MADVHLQTLSNIHIKVCADPGIIMEMADAFTFFAPGYKYHPKFRAKFWDGKISLINRLNGVCYAGLVKKIKQFCDSREYTMTFDEGCQYDNISRQEVEDFIKSLDLPEWIEMREYQIDAVHKCVMAGKRLLLSPTSSGKSLIIHLIQEFYNKKTLIIVPNNGLVDQFKNDLVSYGCTRSIDTSKQVSTKQSGVDADIFICTWQSLDNGKTRASKQFMEQFEVVFADEAHGAKSTSMQKILSALVNCKNRFGTTGTLDGEKLTLYTVEGLLGPIYQNVTARELIDQGDATNIKIRCVVVKYPSAVAKEFRKSGRDGKTPSYQEEIDWIVNNSQRTNLIRKLVNQHNGNRLVFFRFIDHGKALCAAFGDQPNVFYVDGGVKDREAIRVAVEEQEDAILIASGGTTSTGTSIKKLHYMFTTHPMKGRIKLLQSIGRMMRQHESKDVAIVYDIVDDMSTKSYKNFTLRHFEERAKIYDSEAFDYSIHYVTLKD